MKRPLSLLLLIVLALLIAACGAEPAPTPTLEPPAPSPTTAPEPTAAPTPEPAILSIDLEGFEAPNGGFSLQAPAGWSSEPVGGGVKFVAGESDPTSIIAYFQPLLAVDHPAFYLSNVISQTMMVVQSNDQAAFALLADETLQNGHQKFEFIGQLDPEQPLAHLVSELWVESGTLVGLSLSGSTAEWPEIEPLWPLLLQSYQLGDVRNAGAGVGLSYIHPSGQFSVTVPVGWGIMDEDGDTVFFGDSIGIAQVALSATELDHALSPKDLDDAIFTPPVALPEQEGYVELARDAESLYGRMLRFEVLAGEDGFYRTELRALGRGKTLLISSFSAPPHEWDIFVPAYEQLLASLQLPEPKTPDETVQDADPIAGIETGPTLFYKARGGSLWVSAPVYNYRTRNLDDLTAAIQLFDENGGLLAAESWRLEQRIVPAGGTTYVSMRMAPGEWPVEETSYARVEVVGAADSEDETHQPWGYVGGNADINEEGDVKLTMTMRNASNDIRNRIHLVVLLYDAEGELVFVRTETSNLRRQIAPGETVDLELTAWGQIPGVASFDVIGEVPR